MAIEVKIPSVGESITEVQLGNWAKREGDSVKKDETLVEIETDKVTAELPAPEAGTITKILKKTGEQAAVGEVVAVIETSPGNGAAASAPADAPIAPASTPAATTATPKPVHLARASEAAPAAPAKPTAPVAKPAPAPTAPIPLSTTPGREEQAVPMSPMRRRIAERLVQAQANAALLTTFNEVDMTNTMALRAALKDTFLAQHGVKLGFMSFFIKAAIHALKQFPAVNAEVRGNEIIYHNYFDIGVAIGGGKGLVVPILRNAERMSFAEIEKAIESYAKRAAEGKIEIEDLRGGTFTISNGGVYGSLLSTPIVNPPQSGILGMHAIQERPVARDKQVVIRPMMYLALTYDHRLVDGREAVSFLKAIKEVIEEPARMLLEV